jgi:hypothetical protein
VVQSLSIFLFARKIHTRHYLLDLECLVLVGVRLVMTHVAKHQLRLEPGACVVLRQVELKLCSITPPR